MSPTSGSNAPTWDIWLRLTHWMVAGIVFWNLFGPTDKTHRVCGYVAAGLVAGRLAWGVVGSENARFSAWWPSRAHLMEHLRSFLKGRPLPHASHNPLGALMAAALWFIVLALAFSGYLMRLDALWGEDWPQNLHSWLSVGLQICVGLHIVAAIVMSVWTKENLIAGMVTGVRRRKK